MTPANQVPAAPQLLGPSGLMSVFGPLLFSFLGPQGSGRRAAFGLLGAAVVAMNHRFNLQLTIEELGVFASLIATIVVGSNVKEASVTKAQAAASSAVQVAQHEASAAIATAQAGVDAPTAPGSAS